MVAGTSQPTASHWPHGEGSAILIQSLPVNIVASKTDEVFDAFLAPFDFVPVSVQIISEVWTLTNNITFDIADEESTPQVLFNNIDNNVATFTIGNVTGALVHEDTTPDDFGPVLKGAGVLFRYTSGTSDTSTNTIVRFWIRPRYS